jgi:membrane protein
VWQTGGGIYAAMHGQLIGAHARNSTLGRSVQRGDWRSMRLLQRKHGEATDGDYYEERPLPDDAPEPQPEHRESRLDYVAILKRAFKQFNGDHMTNIAAALAYYAFLAIPSALLLGVGIFSLVADPSAVSTLIGKLHGIIPAQASSLLDGSLRNMIQHKGTAVSVLSIGGVLAFWSLTGAMQNLMWALNIAYDRDERRGFVRRRVTALWMVLFALLGFALAFGVLVLGPHLSTWIGNAVHARAAVKIVWYIAEWPLLIGGLLVAFAGFMYYGPNMKDRRWRFLTFGSVFAIVIWLLGSGAFAFYASRFGSYNKTWGSLAAVVVMLTWLWLSSVALLLGAEINAEAERSRLK